MLLLAMLGGLPFGLQGSSDLGDGGIFRLLTRLARLDRLDRAGAPPPISAAWLLISTASSNCIAVQTQHDLAADVADPPPIGTIDRIRPGPALTVGNDRLVIIIGSIVRRRSVTSKTAGRRETFNFRLGSLVGVFVVFGAAAAAAWTTTSSSDLEFVSDVSGRFIELLSIVLVIHSSYYRRRPILRHRRKMTFRLPSFQQVFGLECNAFVYMDADNKRQTLPMVLPNSMIRLIDSIRFTRLRLRRFAWLLR